MTPANKCSLPVHSEGVFHWDIRWPAGGQLWTGAQWNAFGRLVGHPLATEKRRDRKLGCIWVGL